MWDHGNITGDNRPFFKLQISWFVLKWSETSSIIPRKPSGDDCRILSTYLSLDSSELAWEILGWMRIAAFSLESGCVCQENCCGFSMKTSLGYPNLIRRIVFSSHREAIVTFSLKTVPSKYRNNSTSVIGFKSLNATASTEYFFRYITLCFLKRRVFTMCSTFSLTIKWLFAFLFYSTPPTSLWNNINFLSCNFWHINCI